MTERLSSLERKEKSALLARSDVACAVCERSVLEIYAAIDRAKMQSPGKLVTEDIVLESIENVCKFEGSHGQWLRMNMLKEEKDGSVGDKKFSIAPIEGGVLFRSNCDMSCQAMAKSCSNLMDEFDYDMLRDHAFKGGTLQDATALVCNKWTKRCKRDAEVPFDDSKNKAKRRKKTKKRGDEL